MEDKVISMEIIRTPFAEAASFTPTSCGIILIPIKNQGHFRSQILEQLKLNKNLATSISSVNSLHYFGTVK